METNGGVIAGQADKRTRVRMNTEEQPENQALVNFWSETLELSDEEREELGKCGAEDWKELAPSEKLFAAAASLGTRKKVLDYGCGNGWAGIIAAKSGCPDVTAADMAPGAVRTAEAYAKAFGTDAQVRTVCIGADWLRGVPDGTYAGIFCSNVLDVVPPETAEGILRELARIAADDAAVIIGLNFRMDPEKAKSRGQELVNGCMLYINGILRLVSRTDGEWAKIFEPFFTVERLEHFAWAGEPEETRRLFFLRKNITHFMQLQPSPFEMIRNGTKTTELRLYDEKRKKIRIGDRISFTNTVSKEVLNVRVVGLTVSDSFEALYRQLPLTECGYTKEDIDTASPDDMNAYYSKEMQQKYGVVGIKIALCRLEDPSGLPGYLRQTGCHIPAATPE